jgi:hypothetical protein
MYAWLVPARAYTGSSRNAGSCTHTPSLKHVCANIADTRILNSKSLHSWKKPSEPEVAHYFVVFADATSVPRAVNAPAVLAAGASVTPVEAQADLAVTYMQIHPEDSDADRVPPQASTSSAVTSTETMLPLPVPAARAPEPVANGTGVAAPSRVASAFLRDVQEYARSSRPERTWTTSTSADRPSSSTAGMRPLDFKFGTNVIDFSTGFPTALDLPYMGAVVHVDLASMDGANPRPLIALLAKTGAERAAWMLAGAFLRQTGHPASACAVVSAMVEGERLPACTGAMRAPVVFALITAFAVFQR